MAIQHQFQPILDIPQVLQPGPLCKPSGKCWVVKGMYVVTDTAILVKFLGYADGEAKFELLSSASVWAAVLATAERTGAEMVQVNVVDGDPDSIEPFETFEYGQPDQADQADLQSSSEIAEQRIQLEAAIMPQTRAGKLAQELNQFLVDMTEIDRLAAESKACSELIQRKLRQYPLL